MAQNGGGYRGKFVYGSGSKLNYHVTPSSLITSPFPDTLRF